MGALMAVGSRAQFYLQRLLVLVVSMLQDKLVARGSDSASDAPSSASECIKLDQKRTWSPAKSPKDREEAPADNADVHAAIDDAAVRVSAAAWFCVGVCAVGNQTGVLADGVGME